MERIWTDERLKFLKENYPDKGTFYCSQQLGLKKGTVKSKVDRLGLKKLPNPKYERPLFDDMVAISKSFKEVARRIGLTESCGNRTTVKAYIKKYGLNIDHFDSGYSTKRMMGSMKTLNEIMVVDSTYVSTTCLKDRLYKEGLKKRECELCGQGEMWQGKRMSLILDHINGVNTDNRGKNLRIVCPNCNATLDTHGGKNANYKSVATVKLKQRRTVESVCQCGRKKWHKSPNCTRCRAIRDRKTERPSYEQLVRDISELGYLATGKKYGVSDNSIRKWERFYEKEKLTIVVEP